MFNKEKPGEKGLGNTEKSLSINLGEVSNESLKENTEVVVNQLIEKIIAKDFNFYVGKDDEIEKKKEELQSIRNKAIDNGKLLYDGKGKFAGIKGEKVTTHNEETRMISQLSTFKAFFGKSKVKSENGTPHIVYHQTIAEFHTFNKSRTGGYYFSFFNRGVGRGINLLLTGKWKKDIAMPCFLSIENPLILNRNKNRNVFRVGGLQSLKKKRMKQALEKNKSDGVIGFANILYDKGQLDDPYVGIDIYKGNFKHNFKHNSIELVALENTQIKSVYNLFFDKNDPNIYH